MSEHLHSKATLLALLERAIHSNEPKEVVERLQWFVHFTQHQSISKTCAEFGIARSTFYRWYYRLDSEDLSTLRNLPKTHLLRSPQASPSDHVHVCPFCKLSTWIAGVFCKEVLFVLLLMVLLNISFILLLVPQTAKASTWSLKTIISTEPGLIFPEGDGVVDNPYLQFGDTLNKRMTYNRTEAMFHFDAGVEALGTMSGQTIHGQDSLRSSGSLVIDGADIYFNAFDCSGNTNGGALTVDANGRLSCSDDDGGGSSTTLQDAYDNDIDGSDALITLTANDDSVEIINPASGGTDSGYIFTVRQNVTGVGSGMLIDSESTESPILTIGGQTEGESTKNAPHILFGYNNVFDTNLFRSGADTLRTTGKFLADKGVHTDANFTLDSGTSFTGTIDHAITTNRIWTLPDATTELVGTDVTQTLTNKTIDVNNNTIQSVTGALLWYVDGDLAVGTEQSVTLTLPFAFTVTDIELHAKTAPSGSSIIVDINEGGTTIFSTRAEIDSGSTTEDSNHSFSDTSLAKGAEITLDIDQIGSTTAGNGLTVQLMGTIDL